MNSAERRCIRSQATEGRRGTEARSGGCGAMCDTLRIFTLLATAVATVVAGCTDPSTGVTTGPARDRATGTAASSASSGPPPPPNNATYFTNPTADVTETALPDGARRIVFRKELYGYGNYGVTDGKSDILYTGEASTWLFELPSAVAPNDIREASFRVSLIADDHYGVPLDRYRLATWTNDEYVGEDVAQLPHGSPYGTQFSNWVERDFVASTGPMTYSISLLNTSNVGNWFAVDWIELQVVVGPPELPHPVIVNLSPLMGGNAGRTTLTVRGSGFPTGPAVLALSGIGAEIMTPVERIGSSQCVATVNLTSAIPGMRDLSLRFSDGTQALLPKAFEVVAGGGGRLEVSLLGPGVARVNRPTTFLTIIRNTGVNDLGPVDVKVNVTLQSPMPGPGPLLSDQAAASGGLPGTVALDSLGPGVTGIPTIFSIQSCSKVQVKAERRCGAEEDAVNSLRSQLNALLSRLAALQQLFREYECDGANVGSGACVTLALEIKDHKDSSVRVAHELERAEAKLAECLGMSSGSDSGGRQSGEGTISVSAEQVVCPVFSWDPNDLLGPAGAGQNRYVSGLDPLPYTVYFENKAAATAPAQDVVIINTLDPSLDWDTLDLGTVRFGAHTFEPSDSNSGEGFSAIVDLRPERDLLVQIQPHLDRDLGQLQWHFTSLDPATGSPVTDPLAGFLSPNRAPPEGEGSVFYTMRTKTGIPTDTIVRNRASITFDTNEPILTPEWLNMTDSAAPMSHINALQPTQDSSAFMVSWSGTDVGVGVKDYTIFVSDDDVTFVPWLSETSETSSNFVGENGKTYYFYSVARDFVGNAEPVPTDHVYTRVEVPEKARAMHAGGCSIARTTKSYVTIPYVLLAFVVNYVRRRRLKRQV
jgi:hypothetical protein